MLGDLMASVQPIEIKIFGSDHKTLNELARKVAGEIERIEGVEDVFDGDSHCRSIYRSGS